MEIQPLLIFLAWAKYVVVLLTGTEKVFDPLNNGAPPDKAAYQSIVSPVPGDAESVKVPGAHPVSPVPAGAAGMLFMVAVTVILVAETQPVVVFLACA